MQSTFSGRTFVDVPKNIEPELYTRYLVMIQTINQRKFKFEHELTYGQKMRVFFDVDFKKFQSLSFDDFKEMIKPKEVEAQ